MNITRLCPEAENYETVSLQVIQGLLATSKGAKIVTLVTATEPDLKKDDNPYYGKVVKVSRINGIVNWNYTNSVNMQRKREDKEADFVPEKRKWGTRLNDSPFVSHVNKDGENKLYLEVKVERSLGHEYRYVSNGTVISEEKIKEFLKEKKSSKEHQGVQKEIILRDYNTKNILAIVIDKEGYVIQ